ncbi:MAG: glycerol-3-phosphate 1-O-acyltransferase PlsY [Eubacteriales bacterium]|nr:glycerol-3-phosphate 1-O-acyltransferase PlsY [Eubacteriales bacterium]
MYNFLQNGIIQYIKYSPDSRIAPIAVTLAFVVAVIAVGYLLGSVNSSIIVSKIMYGEDIRNSGSGNAGTTNMLRTYGKKAALLTLLGDILKTALAVVIAGILGGFKYQHLYSSSSLCYIAGMFCIIGHVFPVFYNFKGGKGVLCTATVVAILSIKVFALLILLFILLVAMTKYVSLASCTAAIMYPFVLSRFISFSGGKLYSGILLITLAEALLIVWCHRNNLSRLRRGEESKISFRSKKKTDSSVHGASDSKNGGGLGHE